MSSLPFVLSFLLLLTIELDMVNANDDVGVAPTNSSMAGKKIRLDVYYETLCPDSQRFLIQKLVPNYNRIKNLIDLHLHPFGKAQFVESGISYEFYCQHGPKECRGNMIQCCALDIVSDLNISLPFINCMETDLYRMRRPNIDSVGQKCANQTEGIEWKSIEECIGGPRGVQLLLEAGRKTKMLKPKLSFVPTIVVDEKYNDLIQNDALYGDFFELINELYRKRQMEN